MPAASWGAGAVSYRSRSLWGCARPRRAHACDDTVTGAHVRRCDGGAIDGADSIVTTFRLFFTSSKLHSLRSLTHAPGGVAGGEAAHWKELVGWRSASKSVILCVRWEAGARFRCGPGIRAVVINSS